MNAYSDHCPAEAHLKVSHNPPCSIVGKVAGKIPWDAQKKRNIFTESE